MKRLTIKRIGCLCLLVGIVTGCSGNISSLEQAYSFDDNRMIVEGTDSDQGRALAFASDLCVVSADPYMAEGITSEAAAVFAIDGKTTICSKNAFERLHPASTTKIMTALVAIKYGNLSDEVVVTEDAVITEAGATLCKIKPGDVLTMEQLLYGLMLPSGNDAGAAIAVHMGGSIEGFSRMMNDEARRLGATGTHFTNPHGLTEAEHYTTAYDLYLMFNEALKYDEFRMIAGSTSYPATYRDQAGESITQTWEGGNRYMTGEYETPEGLTVFAGKTGTTNAAGNCLVMASRDEQDQEYISVVLKADGRPELYNNMTNIVRKIVN